MIEHIHVKGYRLFKDFETKLQPGINVLIGANATGKSTLIELLRIIRGCAIGPIPPGIEDRPVMGEVFHPESGDTLSWEVTLAILGTSGKRTGRYYEYKVVVRGATPPVIVDESLDRLPSKKHVQDIHAQAVRRTPKGGVAHCAIPQYPVFHASAGRGRVLQGPGRPRPEWKLQPNEPMLSRAVDPELRDAALVRSDLSGWTFLADLRVSRTAPLRKPQPISGAPILQESGDNLAPVLLSLFTNRDYQENRDDILSFMRSAIPDFEDLAPTPDPSGRYVLLQWREAGITKTLSACDLSDGVLRLLHLAVVCCNPHPPSLICIDEPEIGLHPKLLPLVGGLLQHASDRSQVIVLTHSPDLLYDMPLENIAVMRKRDGEAQIVWPRHHDLLYDILTEEIAGEKQVDEERLRLAFRSGELDELG